MAEAWEGGKEKASVSVNAAAWWLFGRGRCCCYCIPPTPPPHPPPHWQDAVGYVLGKGEEAADAASKAAHSAADKVKSG